MTRALLDETHALRDDLLSAFGSTPRMPSSAFADLRASWGDVGQRRLERALRSLVNAGQLERVGRKYTHGGYVRAR